MHGIGHEMKRLQKIQICPFNNLQALLVESSRAVLRPI